MLTIGARAHDYGRREPEQLFELIAADGYGAVMLAFQKAIEGVASYYDVDSALIARTRRALEKSGLKMNTLGVYMELALADEAERKKAAAQFVRGLETAREMGVANAATETTPMKKQPVGTTGGEALSALYRSMQEILPEAERLGVAVCVEPVYYHSLCSIELARRLLDDMGSRYLKITFDPVNLLTPDYAACQHSLWDRAFDMLGDDIEVVHMKGIRLSDGELIKAGFSDSIVDYRYIFKYLKSIDRDIHVIREEVKPELAVADREFLASLC